MEGDPEAAGESPAVRVLQQNTRLGEGGGIGPAVPCEASPHH